MMFIETFNMPIFFFIAGYFALPVIQRKGANEFLKGKVKRLGIPMFLIILLVLPALDYLHYYIQSLAHGIPAVGYIEYWLLAISKIMEFNVGLLDMSTYSYMTDQFYMRYAWFLSELLVFMVIFSLLYVIKKRWLDRVNTTKIGEKISTRESAWKIIILTGIMISLSYFLVDYFTPAGMAFFTIGNIIQFQPVKLGMFAGYFALGLIIYSGKWFSNGIPLASLKKSVLVIALLSIAIILIGRMYVRDTSHSPILYMLFALTFTFLGLAFLILLTSLALKYWNRPSLFQREVVPNSFSMYLVHYIPVMILPLLLSGLSIPAEIKWIVVSTASILISYGISRYVLKPMPLMFSNARRKLKKRVGIATVG
jgi:fucose 4-O-acetylase-like acetyltransferase